MTESSLLNDDVCIGSGDSLPSPRLPPELTDRVIDNLHDSKADLRRCSLVCRSWLPSSSFHLFHYLHIRRDPDSNFDDQSTFNAFITLLQTSPRVYSYLRGLSFESKIPETGFSNRRGRMHLRTLEEILDILPNLLHLDLRLSIFDPTNGVPNRVARGNARKLKTLTFTGVCFGPTPSLMDVLGCFNEVDSLILRDSNYAYYENVTPVIHHASSRLRVRSLSFECALLGCFQTLKHRLDCSSGSLTTLAVDAASVAVASDLEAALQDIGSSLLHLRFCYKSQYRTTFLSPCTRLQSLNLTWGLGSGYDRPMKWEGCMAIIRDGNLSSLTHLSLILRCYVYTTSVGHDPEKWSPTDSYHLESVRWEMLHEATSRCTLLRSIDLDFDLHGLKGHMAGKHDQYFHFVERLKGILWRRMPEPTRSLLKVGSP
ncbi:hypothetical protein PHLCEN_2v10986 [Hermanssonia centrifuga]|uniref:F-box domain-containing protein n=1 Tax=Hermanssonia centrifuga TaxID=98765 RepID=A0A2R6NL60_9APHY|nr:hypothetical protein PHLCEN_2v10986 [Hermanssonia centrifuga]